MRRGGNSHLARAASWGLLDQAIYSASSLLLGVAAARSAGVDTFGYFAVAYLVAVFAIALTRAIAGQPMSILFSDVREATWRTATGQMLRFVAGIAAVLGLLCLLVGVTIAQEGGVFAATGAVLPFVLLQDAYRFALFSRELRATAVAADAIWLGLQTVGTLVLAFCGISSPATLILVWGMSAGVSAIFAGVKTRIVPSNGESGGWRRTIAPMWRAFIVDALFQELPRQSTGWAVTAIAGTSGVGSLRGAEILYGPVTTTAGGIRMSFVPIASSSVRQQGGSATVEGVVGSSIIAAVATLSLVVWVVVPDSVGLRLLGSTWDSAKSLIPALGVALLLQAGGVGGQIRLLAHSAARSVATRRSFVAIVQSVGAILGASVSGPLGAVVGLAVANALGLIVWWLPVPLVVATTAEGADERRPT